MSPAAARSATASSKISRTGSATGCVTWACEPATASGIYLPKSIDSVASVFGILKTGAAYVPVDPGAPARNAYIFANCGVGAALVDSRHAELACGACAAGRDAAPARPGWRGPRPALEAYSITKKPPPARRRATSPRTSRRTTWPTSSTRRAPPASPRGSCSPTATRTSFVDWCSRGPRPDRARTGSPRTPRSTSTSRSSTSTSRLKHGATLVLIGEEHRQGPGAPWSRLIAERAPHHVVFDALGPDAAAAVRRASRACD